MNSVIKTIDNRISLRKYADREVTEDELNIILKSAMRAPTAGNMMLYSIIVIKDDEKKKKLSVTCDNQQFIKDSKVILIFLADMQRWFDYFEYCGVKKYCKDNNIEYSGPKESDLLLATTDAIIAAQNAVIAAESLNIGSCYIGDIMENYETHKEMLNLPNWTFPVGMLCLGHYPNDIKRIPRPRFDREYIVFNEEYKRLDNKDFYKMFKDKEKHLSKDNSLGAKNLGQFVYRRKTGSDFSKEMARSVREGLKNWTGKKL